MPPQQKEWWGAEIRGIEELTRLPKEIIDQIIEDVDEFPIGVEEAREFRGRLMEERKAFGEEVDFLTSTFAFCEH